MSPTENWENRMCLHEDNTKVPSLPGNLLAWFGQIANKSSIAFNFQETFPPGFSCYISHFKSDHFLKRWHHAPLFQIKLSSGLSFMSKNKASFIYKRPRHDTWPSTFCRAAHFLLNGLHFRVNKVPLCTCGGAVRLKKGREGGLILLFSFVGKVCFATFNFRVLGRVTLLPTLGNPLPIMHTFFFQLGSLALASLQGWNPL